MDPEGEGARSFKYKRCRKAGRKRLMASPVPSPGYVQGCRALMITAILLGFLGLFLGMVGLRCTNVGNIDVSRKAKLLAIAGALHILAGNGGDKEHTRRVGCVLGLASPSPLS